MTTPETCRRCGAPLAHDAANDRCPLCLADELLAPTQDAAASADPCTSAGPLPTVDKPDLRLAESRGARIGRYKVVRLLGEGGFGTVFLSEQEHPVRRQVALKIIKPGMDTRQVIARFEAERQALAMMDHPHIAKVLDAGATEAGRPYFVMELVKGVPITQYCDQAKLSPRQRLELFVQVCQAVQHAHQKGIIHRDLKPSNVLVTLADGRPVPKVIDFGIAKATAGRLTEKTLFTEQRQMIGTPEYMSPEQAESSALDVDTRSDIYSLGVLLYELLTGVTPFDPRELRSKAYGEIQRIIQEVEPPRPSTRLSAMKDEKDLAAVASRRSTELGKLRQLLRGDLDWIVMKCLEKDRGRRYETANGLASDVLRHLNDEPVQARPPSTTYRVRKWAARHKLAFISTSAVAAALVLGLGTATFGLVKAKIALNDANTARAAERERSRQLQEAKAETTEKLRNSYLAQAQAGRWSGRVGRRFDSLNALRKAAEIRPGLDLRDEAIACLALVDLKPDREIRIGYSRTPVFGFDATLARYAGGDERGNVGVYDAKDDRPIMQLPGKGKAIGWTLRFSPNGRYLAAEYEKEAIGVWDLDRRAVVLELATDQPDRPAVDFSPDSTQLAVSRPDGVIAFFELPSGRALRQWPADKPASRILFDPTGKRLALLAEGGLRVLDAQDGQVIRAYRPHGGGGIAWHPNGTLVAMGCACSNIHVYDIAQDNELFTLDGGGRGVVIRVAFNRAGNVLASTGWDNYLTLWDFAGRHELMRAPCQFHMVQFSRDGDRLVGGGAGHAHLWEFADGRPYRNSIPLAGVNQMDGAFSPDGSWFASAHANGIDFFDTDTYHRIAKLSQPANAVAFLSDEAGGLSGLLSDDRAEARRWPIRVDPADRGIRVGPAEMYGFNFSGVRPSLSPNGRRLAIGSSLGAFLMVLDPLRPDEARSFGNQPDLNALAVSADGRWVAAAGQFETGKMHVWDALSGRLAKGAPELNQTLQVAFRPDGRHLAASAMTGLEVWEVGSWRRVYSAPYEASTFPGVVTYAQNADLMAFTLPDGAIKLLEATTFRELATIRSTEDLYRGNLIFSRDGANLARVGGHGRTEIWNLREIRRQLASMRLDWEGPAPPPPVAAPRIVVDDGPAVPAPPLRALNIELRALRDRIERTPNSGGAQAALARTLLRLGRFEEAVGPYRRSIELEPGVQDHPYRSALLALYLGDREAYRKTCDAMFERFKTTTDPFVADRTAKTCLAGLSKEDDARPYVELLDVALKSDLKGDVTLWFKLARGLGEHRLGQDREAVQTLTEIQNTSMPPQAKATARYLMAMSLRRLEQGEDARAQFTEAEKLTASLLKPGVDDLEADGHWVENWLLCQIIRREAAATLVP